MKISLDWLSDFVSISDAPQELARKLTLSTAEVEEVIDLRQMYEGVYVGRVLSKWQHPDADRLSLAEVEYGMGTARVVCGAPNLEEGQLVAFATLGTELPNGMKMKKVKIRGEESSGMICAEDELALGEDHSGIMVLDEDVAEVGMPFSEYLGQKDVVLEIDNKSITHRPDLFSHVGIAREIAALSGEKMKEIDLPTIDEADFSDISVRIDDHVDCRRYDGLLLSGIKMNETPDFITRRLEACGMRSKNIVVDVANYVMLEWGQPLHTFDAEKLSGNVVVRRATDGEKVVTLDEKEHELKECDVVIADDKNVVAIAGVMGALNSEVDENTSQIFLEVANFDGPSIRRTARRLGIRSEAVLRFEKGLPVSLVEPAMKRAVELLKEYADAQVMSSIVSDGIQKVDEVHIDLHHEYITRLLGIELSIDEVVLDLEILGFAVSKKNDGIFDVTVPWFREGMEREEDLIEEVGRMRGTDSIKSASFEGIVRPVRKNEELVFAERVRDKLSAVGMDEIYSYAYYGEETASKCGISVDDHLELETPLSSDLQYLRKSLLPYHLDKARINLSHFENFVFYEVGKVFDVDGEERVASGLLYGKKKDVFFHLKSMLVDFCGGLNVELDVEPSKLDDILEKDVVLHGAALKVGDVRIGEIYLVKSDVLKKFSVKRGNVAVFQLDLKNLMAIQSMQKRFEHLSDFPVATIDLAFVVPGDVYVRDLADVIKKESGNLLSEMKIFDVYRGKPLSEDEKSIAFHLKYQSLERTLEDKEVKDIRSRIEKRVADELKGKIRDF